MGRHSIPLARAGYQVTGTDISSVYLAQAKKEARKRGLDLRLIRKDMRRIAFKNEFDAAINLFSSFGYFPNPKDDLLTLKNARQALKPGGLFLVDTINKPRVLRTFQAQQWSELPDGTVILEKSQYLKRESAVRGHWIFLKNGKRREMNSFVRLYDRSSLSRLLKKAGLKVLKVWGQMNGDPYSPLKSHRLVVLGQKPPHKALDKM